MIYERMRVSSTPSRGGALPTYQRKADLYAPGSGVSARIDDSAARIAGAGGDAEARALAGLGNAVKGAVDVGVKAYDDYSKSKATQLITEYRRSMNEALYGDGGILTKQGEAAIDADRQRADRAHQLRDELLKDTNEFTRHYFTTLADDYDADTSLKAQRYADEQHTTMLNRNDEAAANERGEFAIASYKNQQDFDRGAGEGLWHAEQRLRRQGYSGEALARGLKEYTSKVFGGAIQQALADGDIQSAERLLSKGSRIYGEGESAYSRMTAPDIADAKLKIQAKREALQARAEAQRKKAEKAVEEAAIKDATNNILTGVAGYPSLEEQREAAFAHVDSIEDPDKREKVRTAIRQEMAWRETRQDATAAREKRQFRELARNQEWTPRQASAMLDQATDMSDKARDDLRKDFDGKAERATPANKAALAKLRMLLDMGAERGGIDPKDADSIDAYIERHALTYEQGIKAHEYAEQGGAAGELTQAQVNRVYKMLFPKKKSSTIPGDLFDLVADELKRSAPGKAVTDAEVRQVMSRLYLEGESDGSGWIDDTESYAEALRHNRDTAWEIHVPEEDEKRISALLEDAEVRPTPERIRAWYRHEKGFAE